MIKICQGCNKEYTTNYVQSKYCSDECKCTPCIICANPFLNVRRDRKTCSLQCKAEMQKISMLGSNNPNFGNKWDDLRKQKQSEITKSKLTNEIRFKFGSANRGKKFSPERIAKMHDHRTPESYGVQEHTLETKRIIGEKSSNKFTPEFKEKMYNTMVNLGYWISKDLKTDYEIYFKESNWIAPMYNVLYESNKSIIDSHGIFNAFSNTKGVVRDHAFSRKSGFDLCVYPEIMRHIENCDIILHSDNVKKNVSKSISSDSLSLEELFNKIKTTKYEWIEQDICLELIKEYENGNRWKRKGV